MAGRSMNIVGPTLSTPEFLNIQRSPETLLPGGGKLRASSFDANAYPGGYVPAGTFVGRTRANRDGSDLDARGFVLVTAGNVGALDELYLTAFDVQNVGAINDVELLLPGPRTVVKENFLPGWGTLAAAVQTAIRARYTCTVGLP